MSSACSCEGRDTPGHLSRELWGVWSAYITPRRSPKLGGDARPVGAWSTEDRKGGAVVAAARRPADAGVELSRHRRGRRRRDERRHLRTTTSQPLVLITSRMMRITSRSPQA